MGRRPEVSVASLPIAAVDVAGLVGTFAAALVRIPLRVPWKGPSSMPRNVAVASTREFVRSLMGYLTSLPIDEFRAVELLLDDLARVVLPPFVKAQGVTMTNDDVAGVPGLWFRVAGAQPIGTIVYLHGGGYIGTSPSMYAVFMAHLSTTTNCDVFAADYRLAPEFPFPAATEDAVAVVKQLLADGVPVENLFLAGDSGGGGLAGSVLHALQRDGLPLPAAVLLFSPEVSLVLSEPSVRDNAELDILPWNVPSNAYLHGADPEDESVSILTQDLSMWPPTFVVYGADEIFRDPIRSFVLRLQEAGVRHEAHEVAGMFHVFPFLLPWTAESRVAYRQAADFLRTVLPD